MTQTLEFLLAELRMNIATSCHHLRNKAYPDGSASLQSARIHLVYHQLLQDELGLILGHHRHVVEVIKLYLAGGPLDDYLDPEFESIYQYCRQYFEAIDCPLGSSSEELKQWVSANADRHQIDREAFAERFPDVNLFFSGMVEEGEGEMHQPSGAELFNAEVGAFLQDIENGNALEEFNQRMRIVHDMLKAESPMADILLIIEGAKRQP